ncbi:efflux RND transporter periplasmic adaptor subunit [Spirochaeta isovalerica]|uniref:RND family efflux transporter MFP subunit n=1 Tax=Spirochaeta isovalerica TaxID=150 RepID=A0A841REP5_9SPIO|nr:efflux RND transporter periplasmic adaptor subunit [Spirochaeta isovalerica]MBB6481309.1 RND family efflux transporter MFP subunit [Spirochaeta isovalerica]
MSKYITAFISGLAIMLIFSCSAPVAEQNSGSVPAAPEVVVDLTVPPPGSNATQDKWDTFDEAKRQDSWNKYIEGLSASESETDEPAVEEEVVRTPGSGGGGGGGAMSVIPVITGELTKSTLEVYYYGLGELSAGREIRVKPQVTGTVASLYVSIGDIVETGDLLFSLDNNDLVKNIERTSEKWDKDLELAEIKLNDAQDNFETASSLFSKELISQAEVDNARKSWEEARLTYEKLQLSKTSELENLQENLRTTLAISPGRGVVSSLSFGAGDQVNNTDFVEIIDIETIMVTVPVPENIITRIKTGQKVYAKKASSPEYALEGVVSSSALKADSNRTYEVTALFENLNQKLLPGMLIEAQIQLVRLNSDFVIPKESLISEGSGYFIYRVKEDNTAEKVPVQTGSSRGGLIQIKGAVSEGDQLVLQGQSYLQSGMAVNVVETKEYLPERTEF